MVRRGERSNVPKPASKPDKLTGNSISRHQSDRLLRGALLLAQLALLEVFYLVLGKVVSNETVQRYAFSSGR